jgi:hypothetical protein
MEAGGYQGGFTCFRTTEKVPTGVRHPSLPTPTGKVIGGPGTPGNWYSRISERFTTIFPGAAARGTIQVVGMVTLAPGVGT